MTAYEPLLLKPHLDPRPWGGRGLTRFGFELPPDALIGEAWLTGANATVANGPHAGRSLGELVESHPLGAIGERGLALTRGLPLFPMLIKILEASDNLSIQLHPSDEHASPGQLGKTEAWYVLESQPGGTLYLGLRDGVDAAELERLARAGQSTAHLMRQVRAEPGSTYLITPGTVHALGAGVTIYEIQQPSLLTYRLDDWGRVDAHGRPRELHLDAGFAALDPASRPNPIAPIPLPSPAGTRELLVSCPYFALERITLCAHETLAFEEDTAPQVFTVVSGSASLSTGGAPVELSAGQTAAVLASMRSAQITAHTASTIFRGTIGQHTKVTAS